jgi:CDP-diacylglycerol---serine O-phosphatidyltransferase
MESKKFNFKQTSPSKMKKIQFLPNVITAFGLSCGLFVIFKMNMIRFGETTVHNLMATTGILLLAAFADLLDGAVARVMKAESEFGGLFDSLADAISFGVAPSVIILKSLSIDPGTPLSFCVMTSAMIFSVCGVLRLVRFNVNAMEAKGNEELIKANKKNFTGLPIPAAAAAAVSMNLLLFSDEFQFVFALSDIGRTWVLSVVLVLLGYCMVSRWKFPSVKNLQIRVASFQIVFITVVSAAIIFYGILHYFPLMFALVSWSYVLIAWTLSIIRVLAGRKSKTLEDFEPEPEDELDE